MTVRSSDSKNTPDLGKRELSRETTFDPNGVGLVNGNFFGFPYTVDQAKIVLLPVPWDVTTSYGQGTANGPQAILDASPQLDFFDFDVPHAWQIGHGTIPISSDILNKNQILRPIAQEIIKHLEGGGQVGDETIAGPLEQINSASRRLNHWVYQQAQILLAKHKLVGVVGGDHSVPLGLMQALGEKFGSYGILHIDAHADLRQAFEGFTYSHASIMFNALQLEAINCLVQVGIRDLSQQERELANQDGRVIQFDDWQLKASTYQGINWHHQCEKIIAKLPEQVYVSFDIDGLDPRLCPHTGTPVPGGLSFNEAIYLLQTLVKSGKTIIGFDLCEVAPGPDEGWDGNVGARLLYKLANLMFLSQ